MKNLFLAFFLMMTLSGTASGQVPGTSVKLHGISLSCIGAAGQPVPVFFDERAVQLGGGGYAWFDPNRGMQIMLSEKYMNSLSKLGALFVFYHECAHASLPIGVGLLNEKQESVADCHAVSEMRKLGLIPTWREFSEAMAVVANVPGDLKGHLPGPQRLVEAASCAKVPAIYNTNAICRKLDEVFSAGKGHLAKFDGKGTFAGFYCEMSDDKSGLSCWKDIDEDKERVTVAESFSSTVASCLPKGFAKTRSTTMKEFIDQFVNVQSRQSVTVFSDYIGRIYVGVEAK